jgi:hypothetical protein
VIRALLATLTLLLGSVGVAQTVYTGAARVTLSGDVTAEFTVRTPVADFGLTEIVTLATARIDYTDKLFTAGLIGGIGVAYALNDGLVVSTDLRFRALTGSSGFTLEPDLTIIVTYIPAFADPPTPEPPAEPHPPKDAP